VAANLTAEGKGRRQKRPPRAFEAVKGGQFLGKEDGRSARSKTVADTKPTRIDGNRKL
jgi:hypothetical protein